MKTHAVKRGLSIFWLTFFLFQIITPQFLYAHDDFFHPPEAGEENLPVTPLDHSHEDEASEPAEQGPTNLHSLIESDQGVLSMVQEGDENLPQEGALVKVRGRLLPTNIQVAEITPTTAQISWHTNGNSTAIVQYGTTTAYGSMMFDANPVDNHVVSLTDLNPSTVYHYRVISSDANGQRMSGDRTFTTVATDANSPVITAIDASNITTKDAVITWKTNEPSNTQIEYGTTPSYGLKTPLNNTWVTNHSQTLNNLAPNTIYYYRVLSRDAAGNITISENKTFTTKPVQTPPNTANRATLFLNFAGAFIPSWGQWTNVALSGLAGGAASLAQNIVSGIIEKFSIFNVRVTTTDPFISDGDYIHDTAQEAQARYDYYAQNHVMELLFTDTKCTDFYQLVGTTGNCAGLSYVNSYTNDTTNTAIIFGPQLYYNTKYMITAGAHEAAHAFGLEHQSAWDGDVKISEYAVGNGIVSPIMGNAYSLRGQWWNGPSSHGPTDYQNDISVLARATNGFGMRADEAGEAPSTAAAFSNNTGTSFSTYGVITSLQDRDYYEFTTTQTGQVTFVGSVAPNEAMLDLALELRDSSNNLIGVRSTSELGETMSAYLEPGTYYLVARSQGVYYGDLGQYWIKGTVSSGTTSTAGLNALPGVPYIFPGANPFGAGGLAPMAVPQSPLAQGIDSYYGLSTHYDIGAYEKSRALLKRRRNSGRAITERRPKNDAAEDERDNGIGNEMNRGADSATPKLLHDLLLAKEFVVARDVAKQSDSAEQNGENANDPMKFHRFFPFRRG